MGEHTGKLQSPCGANVVSLEIQMSQLCVGFQANCQLGGLRISKTLHTL